jgi:hypothetical protein
MVIDREKRVIFQECPHTGSSFVRSNLEKYNVETVDDWPYKRHTPVAQYDLELLNIEIETYKIFYMVRHPEDRMVSFYKNCQDYMDIKLNPHDFIKSEMKNCKRLKHLTELGSLYSVYNPYKKPNFIYLKYEDFEKSVNTVFNAFQLSIPDISKKVNEHKQAFVLHNRTRTLINNVFHQDFIDYEYEKRK